MSDTEKLWVVRMTGVAYVSASTQQEAQGIALSFCDDVLTYTGLGGLVLEAEPVNPDHTILPGWADEVPFSSREEEEGSEKTVQEWLHEMRSADPETGRAVLRKS